MDAQKAFEDLLNRPLQTERRAEIHLLPPVSAEFVEALNRRFPSRCPTPNMTDREIWIEVGKRQMVELITSHHKNMKG